MQDRSINATNFLKNKFFLKSIDFCGHLFFESVSVMNIDKLLLIAVVSFVGIFNEVRAREIKCLNCHYRYDEQKFRRGCPLCWACEQFASCVREMDLTAQIGGGFLAIAISQSMNWNNWGESRDQVLQPWIDHCRQAINTEYVKSWLNDISSEVQSDVGDTKYKIEVCMQSLKSKTEGMLEGLFDKDPDNLLLISAVTTVMDHGIFFDHQRKGRLVQQNLWQLNGPFPELHLFSLAAIGRSIEQIEKNPRLQNLTMEQLIETIISYAPNQLVILLNQTVDKIKAIPGDQSKNGIVEYVNNNFCK